MSLQATSRSPAARMAVRIRGGLRLLLALPPVVLPAGASRAADTPGVIVAEVKRIRFPLEVEALGTAIANESVDIRPKITETVVSIEFTEGQHVEAGTVLVVRAPFAGRVGLRRVSAGSLVSPATVITTLDDADPIKVDFEVPETALGLLAAGLPIEARSAAWPDTVFHGQVASIDTRVDRVSRTVTVRANVPNRAEMLRPGMFLTVRLLRREATALVVPEQAILPEQSRQYVFVIGAAGTVEKREVQAGRRRPGAVEIVSGLADGDLVVAEGIQKVRAGEKIEVRDRIEVAP